VNEGGIWPLELTCRSEPGFAILEELHVDPGTDLMAMLQPRSAAQLPTHGGFAVGVVLTVRRSVPAGDPYPREVSRWRSALARSRGGATPHFGERCWKAEAR